MLDIGYNKIDRVYRVTITEVIFMGKFLNPGNSSFARILKSYYIDKTGLIECTNKVINTDMKFICNSRPRRFGKSITANMLEAY